MRCSFPKDLFTRFEGNLGTKAAGAPPIAVEVCQIRRCVRVVSISGDVLEEASLSLRARVGAPLASRKDCGHLQSRSYGTWPRAWPQAEQAPFICVHACGRSLHMALLVDMTSDIVLFQRRISASEFPGVDQRSTVRSVRLPEIGS